MSTAESHRSVRCARWTPLVLLLASAACTPSAPEPVVHRGPVVLITVDTLRADVVGALAPSPAEPSLTPHLDRLAAESDWVSTAVAASSWTVPSMASIVTGRQPWSHGNVHGERAVLAEDQRTLAEVFQEAGWQTTGFRSNVWLRPKFGYAQGFDAYYDLGGRKRAVAVLESLTSATGSVPETGEEGAVEGADRQFVWLHVLPPHAPYVRHDQFLERLGPSPLPEGLPARVTAADLETYLDPSIALPDDVRERFWALYRLHTAHADAIVGELLDAIRRSGAWDDTLIAVTSDHGEEFGEEGQIAHGGNLNRVLLEVPLLIKLPRGLRSEGARSLQNERRAVGNTRLFATLAEAIGAQPGDGVLPSLWAATDEKNDAAPAGVLSELYLGNGDNRFSLVETAAGQGQAAGAAAIRQLHWTSRFAAPEAEYFLARRLGDEATLPSGEAPSELWQRQRRAFDTSLPLRGATGRPAVEERLWTAARSASGGSEAPPASPADAASVRRLQNAWRHWNGEEEPPLVRFGETSGTEFTPEEKERLETLGYVVGG